MSHSPYLNCGHEARKTWRTVVETDVFAAQRSKLGNAQRIDEALRRISCTLALDPEQYSIELGTAGIRTAPTDLVEWAGGPIQALRIWYTIQPDGTVLLLAIDQLDDLKVGLGVETNESMMNVSAIPS